MAKCCHPFLPSFGRNLAEGIAETWLSPKRTTGVCGARCGVGSMWLNEEFLTSTSVNAGSSVLVAFLQNKTREKSRLLVASPISSTNTALPRNSINRIPLEFTFPKTWALLRTCPPPATWGLAPATQTHALCAHQSPRIICSAHFLHRAAKQASLGPCLSLEAFASNVSSRCN